jgi:hypothetical protein
MVIEKQLALVPEHFASWVCAVLPGCKAFMLAVSPDGVHE